MCTCCKIALLVVVVFILLVVFWPGRYPDDRGILDRAQKRFHGLVNNTFYYIKKLVPSKEEGSAAESMTMPHFWAQYHKPAVLGK